MSTRFYNHYSWLRTMEDLFSVRHAAPGLDGLGHLGYAAQPGLAPFGADVFNNPRGHGGDSGRGSRALWAVPVTGLAGAVLIPVLGLRRRRPGAG